MNQNYINNPNNDNQNYEKNNFTQNINIDNSMNQDKNNITNYNNTNNNVNNCNTNNNIINNNINNQYIQNNINSTSNITNFSKQNQNNIQNENINNQHTNKINNLQGNNNCQSGSNVLQYKLLKPSIPPKMKMSKYVFPRKGLINLCSTCYMNAVLQCLLHVNDLIVYFINEYPKDQKTLLYINKDSSSNGDISRAFYNLVMGVCDSKNLTNSKKKAVVSVYIIKN